MTHVIWESGRFFNYERNLCISYEQATISKDAGRPSYPTLTIHFSPTRAEEQGRLRDIRACPLSLGKSRLGQCPTTNNTAVPLRLDRLHIVQRALLPRMHTTRQITSGERVMGGAPQ